MTAYNRPHYFKRSVQSILDAFPESIKGLSNPDIIIYAEPCEERDEIKRIALEKLGYVDIIENDKKRGVRDNPYTALDYAFYKGYDYVYYLEDDVIISPDALYLAEWYYYKTISDMSYEHTLCMCTCNYNSNEKYPESLIKNKDFNALGLVITANQWYYKFRKQWHNDDHILSNKGIGWDWSMHAYALENDISIIQPMLSRSNHIGREGGTHCEPEFHDKMFSDMPMSEEPLALNYRLGV